MNDNQVTQLHRSENQNITGECNFKYLMLFREQIETNSHEIIK